MTETQSQPTPAFGPTEREAMQARLAELDKSFRFDPSGRRYSADLIEIARAAIDELGRRDRMVAKVRESDRDILGQIVRAAWIEWAKTQPNPKPSWLVPWSELPETDREADRHIGESVAYWARGALAAEKALSSAAEAKLAAIKARVAKLRARAAGCRANGQDGYAIQIERDAELLEEAMNGLPISSAAEQEKAASHDAEDAEAVQLDEAEENSFSDWYTRNNLVYTTSTELAHAGWDAAIQLERAKSEAREREFRAQLDSRRDSSETVQQPSPIETTAHAEYLSIAAQCWCDPRVAGRTMDPTIVPVFAETMEARERELRAQVESLHAESRDAGVEIGTLRRAAARLRIDLTAAQRAVADRDGALVKVRGTLDEISCLVELEPRIRREIQDRVCKFIDEAIVARTKGGER